MKIQQRNGNKIVTIVFQIGYNYIIARVYLFKMPVLGTRNGSHKTGNWKIHKKTPTILCKTVAKANLIV